MPAETLNTEITRLFKIKYPILLAGMNVAAGPELAAAVTNAGGLGVIGGLGFTPENLRKQINIVKSHLKNKNAPFGVDLLLPQVGGNARKTNKDYTGGQLPGLIDVIIQEKTSLFVCAVGVPPKWAVDKLHAAGIPVMNMIGAPKHAVKALEVGVDIICAQGGEGGGHTGEIATSILIPKVVDIVKGRISPLTGKQVPVLAAGGIFDGRSLAMALCLGAQGVWVGTRFVAAVEAGAPPRHKKAIVGADYQDTIRTIIFTGRPMRVLKNPYIMDWEENKASKIKELTAKGVLPVMYDMDVISKKNDGNIPTEVLIQSNPLLMGQYRMTELQPSKSFLNLLQFLSSSLAYHSGAIQDIKPAAEIVDEMVSQAVAVLKETSGYIAPTPKL
ncbi:NPD-domain-containing protein [Gonapodya prolifera JEL478]|uniref:NPD-domain-containing protein n=1 Tax=Gonapodya prolifera (strain JEL478) TaxID=1344416 RepID=A0A139A3M1_GONPJ|nr:NPD-domain-containing protein [Gonapodya prolifera JEL478]|eukprot:KXS10973.1 NPD-domain-containing protein [Gonapodya prolifera JEL478]